MPENIDTGTSEGENGASADSNDIERIAPLSRHQRLAMLLLPVVLFWIGAAVVYFGFGRRPFSFFMANAVGNFVGGGKLVILSGSLPNAPFSSWSVAALVIYSDLSVSLMLLAVIHVLYRLPIVGRPFTRVRISGQRILDRRPWIRRAAFWAVALFVAMPFQGTGALLGTMIGRLAGLSRTAVVAAVVLGSGLGCAAIVGLAHVSRRHLALLVEEPLLGLLTSAVVIAAMVAAGKRLAGGGDT